VDPDWVITKLDPRTRVVWVLQAKDEAQVSAGSSLSPPLRRSGCFTIQCTLLALLFAAEDTL